MRELAGGGGAQLRHQNVGSPARGQQRGRDAEAIVVALGSDGHLKAFAQDRAEELLGAGLPDAPGDGDHFHVEPVSIPLRESLQRTQRVIDRDVRAGVSRHSLQRIVGHDAGHRAAPPGLFDKLVPVEALPPQRDEERIPRE